MHCPLKCCRTPHEVARQIAILELVSTEMQYIQHLVTIVEVYIAAAYALQDADIMRDVDLDKVYPFMPEMLRASVLFWETALFPMVQQGLKDKMLNTNLMYGGFFRFRELLQPYERFVMEQTKTMDYIRSLNNHTEFQLYLSWCYSQCPQNKLMINDLMVKPMQRLTKYALLLRRIIDLTDSEPERTNLVAMEAFAKNYVIDLNRSVRQREELEKVDRIIDTVDGYELDFKDEEMDRVFRMYSALNLKAPMVGCLPTHSRTLVYEGDMRFKDHNRDARVELVRVILLTDMMLICKKVNPKSNSTYLYKVIRPKYMVEKMMHFYQYTKTQRPVLCGILIVMLDEVGTSFQCISLQEPTKESNPALLKTWEQKFREAKLTYDYGLMFSKYPDRDISDIDMDSSSEYALRPDSLKWNTPMSQEDIMIDREARERVAVMLHRSMGASTENDVSQASMATDSIEDLSHANMSARFSLRNPLMRTSSNSSRNSRISSYQYSSAENEDPQMIPSSSNYPYRAGSSVEHVIPPMHPEEAATSITVNVVSESDAESVVMPIQGRGRDHLMFPKRSPTSSTSSSHRTLQPSSGVAALVHSLPDLSLTCSRPTSPSPQPSTEKKKTTIKELQLKKNRLSASSHAHLRPDHRGKSYPPPSPTRASLKRGYAFSYSFKYSRLEKLGHVGSQSGQTAEGLPGSSPHGSRTPSPLGGKTPVPQFPLLHRKPFEKPPSIEVPTPGPSHPVALPIRRKTSSPLQDVRRKLFSARHKKGEQSKSTEGTSQKDEDLKSKEKEGETPPKDKQPKQ